MRTETQESRLLRLLEDRHAQDFDGWVSLPRIMDLRISSHSKIVSLLRQHGSVIEIERQNQSDGRMFTRYRLVK